MTRNWLNLLFALLAAMILVLSWHLAASAEGAAAASLIIQLLTPLSFLLIIGLFFVLSRTLVKLYFDRSKQRTGFRLKTKLVLSILPLTLIPAIMMLLFSTGFLDRLLSNLSVDRNIASIIEHSNRLNDTYLEDIHDLHVKHGPKLAALVNAGEPGAADAYLNGFALQGIEVYRDGVFEKRVLGEAYPANKVARLDEVLNDANLPAVYDDGFYIWKFPYDQGNLRLDFIFARDTGFTERFRFVRASYEALRHAQQNEENVRGLYRSTLIILTLAIIFAGVWTGLTFARTFITAFNSLISGTKEVEKGNLDARIELRTGDEIEDVVQAFNSMTMTLKNNRRELEQRAVKLRELNDLLEGQIEYTQTILQEINAGILSVDQNDQVLTHNPAALNILGIPHPQGAPNLAELLDPKKHLALIRLWQTFKESDADDLFTHLELVDEDEKKTSYLALTIVPLQQEGAHLGRLLVLEDLTSLLNAQKLAAWREVAKRIAHEIKNPLTPIQLSIQRVRRKAETEAPDLNKAIESAYETIMSETNLLKNLVNEFSTFAKLPAPAKEEVDMAELARAVCESYDRVYPQLKIRPDVPAANMTVHCDPSQMRQVLTNLINNAALASEKGGTITVSAQINERELLLEVIDQGSGIPLDEREKVFIPYYSKSPKGTGLGLAIVKRIVEDHGGDITIADNHPKGTRFIIKLPRGTA